MQNDKVGWAGLERKTGLQAKLCCKQNCVASLQIATRKHAHDQEQHSYHDLRLLLVAEPFDMVTPGISS